MVLIVDEAPMLHGKKLKAMDRRFRDIRDNEDVMEGLPSLTCGDLRHILPVVRGGTRAKFVGACLKRSVLWQNVTVYNLKTMIWEQLSVEIQTLRCFQICCQEQAMERSLLIPRQMWYHWQSSEQQRRPTKNLFRKFFQALLKTFKMKHHCC